MTTNQELLAAMQEVVARARTWRHSHKGLGNVEALAAAVDHYEVVAKNATHVEVPAVDDIRVQTFHEVADLVEQVKPITTNPDYRRGLEAYQTAIAAGLRIAAKLIVSGEKPVQVPIVEEPEEPRCPKCKSTRWVSVSLDGGYTRKAQCVPCGAYHVVNIGPGWQSPAYNDPEAVHPAYRRQTEEDK